MTVVLPALLLTDGTDAVAVVLACAFGADRTDAVRSMLTTAHLAHRTDTGDAVISAELVFNLFGGQHLHSP